ncbi:MAG: repeat-containing protein [Bacteroidetes bacterium]|nr:repeat-containing protein [Bacteroidota bacterium]
MILKRICIVWLLVQVLTADAQELIPYCKNGVYGYSNFKGELIIQPAFERASRFYDNRSIVKEKGLYFLIDEKGKKVSTTGYTDIDIEGEEQIFGYKVTIRDSVGLIDRNGKSVLPVIYKDLEHYGFGVEAELPNGKGVWFSPHGKKLIASDSAVSVDENEQDSLYIASYLSGKIFLSSIYTKKNEKIFGPVESELRMENLEGTGIYIVESRGKIKEVALLKETGDWLIKFTPGTKEAGLIIDKAKYREKNLEKICMDRYVNPSAYLDFLNTTYIATGYEDSLQKLFTLSGKELLSLKKTPTGIEIRSKSGTIKTTYSGKDVFSKHQVLYQQLFSIDLEDKIKDKDRSYFFTRKGELINKKPYTDYIDNEPALEKFGLIRVVDDSLKGLLYSDGKPYISLTYKFLETNSDSTIILTKHNGKSAILKFPHTEADLTEDSWYDDINNKDPDLILVTLLKDGKKLYGTLDRNFKAGIQPSLYRCKRIDDVVLGYIDEAMQKPVIVDKAGNRTSIADSMELETSLNGAERQFIFRTPTGFIYLADDKIVRLPGIGAETDGVSVKNTMTVNGTHYVSILKRNPDMIEVYRIKDQEISLIIPFTGSSSATESPVGFTLLNKDSLINFMSLDGTEKVPYGKWDYIDDYRFFNDRTKKHSQSVFIANGPKSSAVYNSRGEKLFECRECTITAENYFYEIPFPNFTVTGNKEENPWNMIYLYSETTQKIVPVPFAGEGYEDLSDTSFLFRDTSRAAYIYFVPQQQLVKMPFTFQSYVSSDMETSSSFFFQDMKNRYYFYDAKNGNFKQLPGYINDFSPIYETWSTSHHQYFYFYADSTMTKRGIMDENGTILAQPIYETIDMPNDYEELALYVAFTAERTDLIPLQGAIVSPGKKYTSSSFEDESVFYGEYEEEGKKRYHLFNSFNQYKRFEYDFKGDPMYATTEKIGNKWFAVFEMPFYESTSAGETGDTDRTYILYVSENGKPYFEFDGRFRPIEN